jgi:DNA-binding MarR family transcriptional regulator
MVATRNLAQRIAGECLGLRARLLTRVVTRIFDEELRPLDLKVGQLTILVALSLTPGVRPARLVESLHLEKSTLSRNLARMEGRGWIATSDGLSLTAAGEAVLREAYPVWKRAQKRVAARLGSDGAAALAGVAEELR